MLLKTTRFVSLLCASVALGLTLTHDLEIPGKQMLSGADWLAVQRTFYGGFAIVGGWLKSSVLSQQASSSSSCVHTGEPLP